MEDRRHTRGREVGRKREDAQGQKGPDVDGVRVKDQRRALALVYWQAGYRTLVRHEARIDDIVNRWQCSVLENFAAEPSLFNIVASVAVGVYHHSSGVHEVSATAVVWPALLERTDRAIARDHRRRCANGARR